MMDGCVLCLICATNGGGKQDSKVKLIQVLPILQEVGSGGKLLAEKN